MRVAMRASMGSDHPDLGADSVGELPLREWAHVVFTFTNRSSPSSGALSEPFEGNDVKNHPWGFGERHSLPSCSHHSHSNLVFVGTPSSILCLLSLFHSQLSL
jgi:hypothetical protein